MRHFSDPPYLQQVLTISCREEAVNQREEGGTAMPSKQEETPMNQSHPTIRHKCRQATVRSAYYQGEARIQVACPSAEVYALVAAITRMGAWRPECYRCEGLAGG